MKRKNSNSQTLEKLRITSNHGHAMRPTMRYHLTPARSYYPKDKEDIIINVGEVEGEKRYHNTVGRNANYCNYYGKQCKDCSKNKRNTDLSYDPAILSLGIWPRDLGEHMRALS